MHKSRYSAKRQSESPISHPKAIKIDEDQDNGQPKFTFDQVKRMLEVMLEDNEKNRKTLVSNGLRNYDFNQIAVPGHSVDQCKELIDTLVKNTRRTRTFNEVLSEIKDNLERKTYTEIIQRASLDKRNLPKRPPSAYLLYHKDRFQELKEEHSLAAEISKIVSDEWKNLPVAKKKDYEKKYRKLMRGYERELKKLGLVDSVKPKRPTARALYVQDRLESINLEDHSKQEILEMQKQYGNEFDDLDKEIKKHWNNLAEEKLAQYNQEREQFTASHPHLKPRSAPGRKPGTKMPNGTIEKKPDFPIPPRGPLKLFIEKKMPEDLAGEEAEDLKRKLKEKFDHSSPKKQLKFIKKAVKDKARYDEEVEEFLQEHPEYSDKLKKKDSKPNLTKEQLKLYQTMVEKRPTLPSPNAYLYYCGKLLSADTYSPGYDPTRRMVDASQGWRSLSEEERANLEQEHEDSIENYINEMTNWLGTIDDDRRKHIMMEEPRSNPDYWRKKLNKQRKAAAKKNSD